MAWFPNESANDTVVIAAVLATIGWIYTARRSRSLARKQHTIDVMLMGSFDNEMRNANAIISPYVRGEKNFPTAIDPEYNDFIKALKQVLNHYEFLAAGIRRGDISEILVLDALRGSILNSYEKSEKYIFQLRDTRRNQAIYEHIEWIHKRWEKAPPSALCKFFERCKGGPFQGRRVSVRD